MKKDKKWLKDEVKVFQEGENMFTAEFNAGVQDALEYVQELIDQLDEPEVKQLDKKIKELESYNDELIRDNNQLRNQLDEPKKPVIPQFVADYIEKWKSEGLTMSEWFGFNYDDEVQHKVFKWLYDNDYEESTSREDLLIDAIRHGYEVEKEPKYYVLDKEGDTLLKKSAVSEGVAKSVGTNIHSAKSWKDEKKYQLTEQEIKDYDERYWAFAEEVIQ